MALGDFEFAHTRKELVAKLRLLGIATAVHASIGEGLDGEHDIAISFALPRGKVQTVGFSSSEISFTTATEVMAALTILVRQPTRQHNEFVSITDYHLPRPLA